MRDVSGLQVDPARLLGQPLLEASGTGMAVILQPDTSRTAGVRVAGDDGSSCISSAMSRKAFRWPDVREHHRPKDPEH